MNKRSIIKFVGIGMLTIALSAFKLPSIGGGGDSGGADWKAIAGEFNGGLKQVSKAMELALDGIIESQKAIGLKTEAAIQLKNETAKANSGSAIPVEIVEKQVKYVKDATEELASALEGKKLSAQEKEALAKASANYTKGLLNGFVGYVKVAITFKKAQKAGTPKPMDLMGAAKDIPSIVANLPAVFEAIPVAYDAYKVYNKSLKAADISIPKNTDKAIDDAKADIMKGMV